MIGRTTHKHGDRLCPGVGGALPITIIFACVLAPVSFADTEQTIFRNARVLTMSEAGVLDNATVVVEGEKITRVTIEPVEAAADARVIDAAGRTLMPGLADMHVHYFSANEGPLYLANSTTTVRNLWGSTQTIMLDTMAKTGSAVGPHVYTSGPLIDGPEPIWGDGSIKVTTPEQAVGAIESQKKTGYRAVKLYEGLTPEIYRAAVAAAKERNMQVWTHTPTGLTVADVIALGVDSIEHFEDIEEYVYTHDGDEAANPGYFDRWADADADKLREIATASAAAGVWHTPTFAVIAKRYEYGSDAEAFFERPEAAFIGPGVSSWWRGSGARMGEYTERKQAARDRQLEFAKMLYDMGAPLLIGTDTPNPFVVPGYAIHDELDMFVQAGVPVADVLRVATADAARFLNEAGQWGVVSEGARADLVLLETDPHDELAALRSPLGVMVNGHWRNRAELQGELDALRERHAISAAEAVSGQ